MTHWDIRESLGFLPWFLSHCPGFWRFTLRDQGGGEPKEIVVSDGRQVGSVRDLVWVLECWDRPPGPGHPWGTVSLILVSTGRRETEKIQRRTGQETSQPHETDEVYCVCL